MEARSRRVLLHPESPPSEKHTRPGKPNTMSTRVAILQSSYIPWKGYFDIINMVDRFILFDDVQFTRRDWRSRNRIKSANGPIWLSIPTANKGRYLENIEDIRVADPLWCRRHWASIESAYRKAPHFTDHAEAVRDLYRRAEGVEMLSAVNHLFLEGLCGLLGIATTMNWSREFPVEGRKTDRLVALCRAVGASSYLSGPSARSYIEPEKFEEAGITLEYVDYSGYPEYDQLHGAFDHAVSVLDLLFMTGPKAGGFMKSFAPPPPDGAPG